LSRNFIALYEGIGGLLRYSSHPPRQSHFTELEGR